MLIESVNSLLLTSQNLLAAKDLRGQVASGS